MAVMTMSTGTAAPIEVAQSVEWRAPRHLRVVTQPAAPAGPVRLTRRGRLVLVLLVAGLAIVLFGLGRASATSPGGSPAAAVPNVVTVQPGDTLWSISQRLWPRADPRDGVAALLRANHLREGAALPVGAQISVR